MPLFSSPGNGEREGVYMEGVECACMGRGRVCAYGKGGVCMHGEREGGRGVDVGNISVVKAVD